jgi:hypothetical protein
LASPLKHKVPPKSYTRHKIRQSAVALTKAHPSHLLGWN